MSGIILCQQVRELRSLYIYIYILCNYSIKGFFHMVIYHIFLFDTGNYILEVPVV